MNRCKLPMFLLSALLTLGQTAYSGITMESHWPLGEGAAIGTDTAADTANPFNNTTGSSIQAATPSAAAGSAKYARTSGVNYQGIWMFGAGSTAQTVPSDNWGVQLNVRIPTLPATGTYKVVFGMSEGVSAGLVIEANNIGGTTYFDVNKQGTANYIIPRNASVTVAANTWYNLALVKSGGTTTFYVNGTAVGNNAGAINTSGLLGLGFEQNVGTHQLAADFDEARFFTFSAGQFNAAVDLSMTLRTVTYNGNGGTGTEPTDSASYWPGTPVTVLGAGSLVRTGYTFSGWNTAADGSGSAYAPAATFSSPDANTTLFAQWTAATATITANATFPAPLTTTYGSASGATSVAVSGTSLTADITATAPANFEVSGDGITYGNTAVFTQTGGSAAGTLYLRIRNNAPVSGGYDSQNVILTSIGASPVNVATTASGNSVAAKALTIISAAAQDKMFDGTTTGTVLGTLDAAEDFGTGSGADGRPYTGDVVSASAPGTFASSAVGTGIAVTAGTFTLGGAAAGNYTVTQPTGLGLAAAIRDTAVWTQPAGGSWPTGGNWENGAVGVGANNTADFSTLDLTGNATATLDGARTIGNLVFGDTDPSHDWTLNTGTGGPLTLAVTSGSPTIAVNNRTTTIAANLAGTQGLAKTGDGTLVLTGTATGSAMDMAVNGGTLNLQRAGLAYNNAGGAANGGVLTINSGGTLDVAGPYNIGYQQQVNIDGGTLAISNTNGGDGQNYTLNLNFTGGGTISGPGALRWGELADATITVNGTTPATIGSDLWTISTGNKSGTVNVVDPAGVLNFTGGIKPHTYGPASGPVPLIKTGAGTLILAGVNTYTGATTINGGTLSVTGSTGASAITVAAAGTLSGTGTIGGAVSVAGSLQPGTEDIGSLTINNTLTLQAGSTTNMRIDKTDGLTTSDELFVSTVNYGGTLTVTASGEALAVGDTFYLFTATTRNGSFATVNLPALTAPLTWDYSGLATDGTIRVVDTLPTPTFSPLAGGYIGEQTVTITCSEPGTTIFYTYTTDETAPADPTILSDSGAAGSSTATVTVPVDTVKFIKAMAVKFGSANSPVVQADFRTVAAPVWIYDGSGVWSDDTNWQAGAIAQGAGVTADFSTLELTGSPMVTLNGARTIGSLAFGDLGNAYGWTLNASGGSVLTLDNGASPSVITVNDQTTLIGAVLAGGASGVTKAGAGTLSLSGANTFTGNLEIGEGTAIGAGAGAGNANPTATAIGNMGTAMTGRTVTLGSGATLQFAATDAIGDHAYLGPVVLIADGGTITRTGGAFNSLGNIHLANGAHLTGNSGQNATVRSLALNGTITVAGTSGSFVDNAGTSNAGIHLVCGRSGMPGNIGSTVFDVAPTGDPTADLTVSAPLVNGFSYNPDTFAFSTATTSGLTKTGLGRMVLTGPNTYSGVTAVNAGALVLGASDTLADAGNVSLGAATLAVAAAVSDTVGSLAVTGAATLDLGAGAALRFADSSAVNWTGGTLAVTGTFVSGSSLRFGTTNTGLTEIQIGQITIAGHPSLALNADGYLVDAGGYDSWKSANGTTGGPNADHDNDGVPNAIEYFIGGPNDTTGFTPLPGIAGNSVTYTKHAGFTGTYGSDFIIETSETLDGAWSPETLGGTVIQSGDSFTYTFPPGGPAKKFVRLAVTVP